MRIFDLNGAELAAPDMEKGWLRQGTRFVQHHEAVAAAPEQGHWETTAEYPNGGKDVVWVVDVAAVAACEAWDEYEDVLIYVPYTDEELAAIEEERNKPTEEERIAQLEAALELLLSGVTE